MYGAIYAFFNYVILGNEADEKFGNLTRNFINETSKVEYLIDKLAMNLKIN